MSENYLKHFGESSENYLRFRPDYPDSLYHFLSQLVPQHDLVWDVGTGNGQAAVKLADYFKEVIATDINKDQLAVAIKKNNITYFECPAEKTELKNSSVNLITVAQAVHWFNFDAFYNEVKRVAKPDGVIALWCYSLCKINPTIDVLIEKLYFEILKDAWPKERFYIDQEYKTLPFPFKKIPAPKFSIEKKFNLAELLGYLNTWSAVKEYQKREKKNPLDLISVNLFKAWKHPEEAYRIRWPIHMLVGYV